MSLPVHTRAAEAGDVARMVELFGQLGYANTAADVRERLGAHFGSRDDRVFVAESDGVICGVVVVVVLHPMHLPAPRATISALVVDENMRSRGVGAVLVQRSEQHAADTGCSHLELASRDFRTRAHAFYEGIGFVEVRKRFVKELGKL
ncbi:GNAT family N-acetyltransferase [Massilia glaciei]|uniref:N-acetyltransferase n=1 Tax=Massilia glaciei TaxID=1524097 RepID=A0A2U2HDJ1_9BURK|nr:GNAT family N-acetyltransferase [Massilia glaciei]PWF41066.1 N-acetyltransferase [Massilia glaciei]